MTCNLEPLKVVYSSKKRLRAHCYRITGVRLQLFDVGMDKSCIVMQMDAATTRPQSKSKPFYDIKNDTHKSPSMAQWYVIVSNHERAYLTMYPTPSPRFYSLPSSPPNFLWHNNTCLIFSILLRTSISVDLTWKPASHHQHPPPVFYLISLFDCWEVMQRAESQAYELPKGSFTCTA